MRSVVFYTEGSFRGKYPRSFKHSRVDVAWQLALDAEHAPLGTTLTKKFDVAIVIFPKHNPTFDVSYINADQIFIMQEGPNWYWQDYPLVDQINYLNLINSEDVAGVLCHNQSDIRYYQGITSKPVYTLPTVVNEDCLALTLRKPLPPHQRSGTMIGGNMVSWYGGMDSLIIAGTLGEDVVGPTMGRAQPDEQYFDEVTRLPHMEWSQWMQNLQTKKYAVHLMRTHAAGTFALNCAYYGIPCIGYEGLDTQQICHPKLTVAVGDLNRAQELANHLATSEEFYMHCSVLARDQYEKRYQESSGAWAANSEFVQLELLKK